MGLRVWQNASKLCSTFLRSNAFASSSRSLPAGSAFLRSAYCSWDVHNQSKSFTQTICLPMGNMNFNLAHCRTITTDTAKSEKSSEEKANNESKKSEETATGSPETVYIGKRVRGGPVSWMSLVFLLITGAGLLVFFDREKKRRIEEIQARVTEAKGGESVGKAAIGGPFNLLNDEGKPVTEQDFKGKWTLIYFGFTHCPDICPDELQKMVSAIDKIKEKASLEVVPVFISVDPERDTVEQVHEYVQEFHPNLIGLTGNKDDIRQVAREFRVYYMKTEEEDDSDYLVDHSIIVYLMDPEFEFVKFFGKNYDVDSLTNEVIKEIRSYKS
eukprot:TRINITY_DN25699_c0_g1_i1.p1 TRINITY_DN25699_c0_g1~~TRINITY_DN25699_c0_g1_i1.p1  ORF type:complete len:328 (+),score=59.47 TRINITY_DN25699_c0_g1_i1:116-1099(+)